MKNIIVFTLFLILCASRAGSQITVERGAIFYIQHKANVIFQGDLSAWNDITGGGYLEVASAQKASIHMHGFQIDNLVLRSPAILESDLTVTSTINLQSGQLDLNNHNIVLGEHASITGGGNNYIRTTAAGTVKKMISGTLSGYMIPVGTSTSYLPLQISAGAESQYGAVTVSARQRISDHKPFHVTDYLKHYWIIEEQGNLDHLTVTGFYHQKDITGNAARISAYYWDGNSWKSQFIDNKKGGEVTALITSPTGELYAMNDIVRNTGIKLLNNPVHSYANLQFDSPVNKNYHVVLRDVTGRQLQQTDLKLSMGVSQHTIYLNGLSDGTYILDVSSGSEKQTLKFLKVR